LKSKLKLTDTDQKVLILGPLNEYARSRSLLL
jgi:hypothetical protein